MTIFLKILLSLILVNSIQLKAQNVDSNIIINENRLPIDWYSSIKVKVDNTTPLDKLILRLNTKRNFIEYEGSWLLTEDMLSIASRGDIVIPKLLTFFKEHANLHGKKGVIYTLYLIGINRKVGIFTYSEKFTNVNAKKALLELLNEKVHVYTICEMLRVDRKESDVGKLFEILRTDQNESTIWPILNYLAFSPLENIPLCNKVPDSISKLKVSWLLGNNHLHKNDESQIKYALKLLSDEFPNTIIVEKKFYTNRLTVGWFWFMEDWIDAGYFISTALWSNFYYYYSDNKLFFITFSTAREILLKWWNNLPANVKRKYY